ncbi:hypothetical protein E2C01_076775 [Portunus trituberculatus]|uniref:Uncharacterized protein n=1 Tax=Portunus trituberculatus TaxID=210409 RepID=A0A5B7IJH0_PORTR|nr:hypothetical protein [Portunus trituberculatus]
MRLLPGCPRTCNAPLHLDVNGGPQVNMINADKSPARDTSASMSPSGPLLSPPASPIVPPSLLQSLLVSSNLFQSLICSPSLLQSLPAPIASLLPLSSTS